MKKYIILFTLLCMVGRIANATETLTVYDGTETNNTVPAYIYFFDQFSRSQFVLPAD